MKVKKLISGLLVLSMFLVNVSLVSAHEASNVQDEQNSSEAKILNNRSKRELTPEQERRFKEGVSCRHTCGIKISDLKKALK